MDKTCNTCQHRNAQGICTNHDSVFFGSRVDDGTCPVWENYDTEWVQTFEPVEKTVEIMYGMC